MSGRAKGGRISLTAFEATWLRLVIDTCPSDAQAALEYVDLSPPKAVVEDPWAAWDRIIEKVAAVTPLSPTNRDQREPSA